MRSIIVTTAAPITFTITMPITVAVIPGSGGTLLVEYQLVPDGLWYPWSAGAAATKTVYALVSPVNALRFTATTADGIVEVTQ